MLKDNYANNGIRILRLCLPNRRDTDTKAFHKTPTVLLLVLHIMGKSGKETEKYQTSEMNVCCLKTSFRRKNKVFLKSIKAADEYWKTIWSIIIPVRARIQQSFSIKSVFISVGFSTETFSKKIKPVVAEKHEFDNGDDSFFLSLLQSSDY